ncbi:hypothetical protein CR513_44301, partial [Mucuna pruriens]
MEERSMFQDLRPKFRDELPLEIGKHHFPSIDNVLYVEGLKHNPLSMNQLCENEYDISFNKREYMVKNIDGSLLFSSKRQNNLCRVNLIDLLDQNKLGHASLRLISKLSKHHLVRALPNIIFKSFFCVEYRSFEIDTHRYIWSIQNYLYRWRTIWTSSS